MTPNGKPRDFAALPYRAWSEALAEQLSARLRTRSLARSARGPARRLLAEVFDALHNASISPDLHRRLDDVATPPGPQIGFRRRIGVWRDLTIIDGPLVDRCVERWEWAEAKGDRLDAFMTAVGFDSAPTTLRVPREGEPDPLELDLTEG